MDCPGLQQLLADIEAEIDTIVVYKVGRLARSLPDFAKIVEVLDAQNVFFVQIGDGAVQHDDLDGSAHAQRALVRAVRARGDRSGFWDKIAASKLREAAILSRMRSPVTSRSNCAKESSMFSVRRPIEVVVLNCWVTDTNETLLASKPRRSSRSRRATG